ncbi:MAG: hypothetical protein CHACPFDD_00982 [Phycisphaerae bacterium]|nr:hypothetical protein [Phycisphaerae bacterium]
MWIDRVTSSSLISALELSARFSEERHRVLADNVANIDTPDYATKRLDPAAFEASLREALERQDSAEAAGDGRDGLELRGNAQFRTTDDGAIEVAPAVEPAGNVLFHDGTNAGVERLMTDVAGNKLRYEMLTSLLRNEFDGLQSAIRGRVS